MGDRIRRVNGAGGRRGMVLVVALLLMAIMSIIGATAITSSRMDLHISASTKQHRQAFYFADGGVEESPKYIRRMIEDGALPVVPGVAMDAGLYNEVMGYNPPGPDQTDWVRPSQTGATPGVDVQNPDYTQLMGDNRVRGDIDRAGTAMAAGSGVEFGAGAEGAGVGSTGGVLIFYDVNTYGELTETNTGSTVSKSYLDVYYRLVVGVAGGK